MFNEKFGAPYSLFHGTNGSRCLALDEWIDADVKEVKDGSNGKLYRSGFHVFLSKEDVILFLHKFRTLNSRVICAVEVDTDYGLWDKSHSSSNVKLAGRIRISSIDWMNRTKDLDQIASSPNSINVHPNF